MTIYRAEQQAPLKTGVIHITGGDEIPAFTLKPVSRRIMPIVVTPAVALIAPYPIRMFQLS